MSGFIYIWRDKKHNRYYIGSHWGSEDDEYICSSDSMREAYRRRPADFKRRIVSKVITIRKDLLEEEQHWLDMIKPEEFGRRYYNINSKVSFRYWWINEETKKIVGQKISKKLKEKFNNPEYSENFRQKTLAWHQITKNIEKKKQLIKEVMNRPEVIAKCSAAKKGKLGNRKGSKNSLETIQKIIEWRKNLSEEEKQIQFEKHSAAQKKRYEGKPGPFKGKNHSEKSKEKMSKANIGKTAWNKGKPMSEESKYKMIQTKKLRKKT